MAESKIEHSGISPEDAEMADRFSTEAAEMLTCLRGVAVGRDDIAALCIFISWFRRKWGVESRTRRELPEMSREATILTMGMEMGCMLQMAQRWKHDPDDGFSQREADDAAHSIMNAYAVIGGLLCDNAPEVETIIAYCRNVLNEKKPETH